MNVPARAGAWFLRSGIQRADGGVARYYDAGLERNRKVSTEITGYAASTLAYLHSVTSDRLYLDAAAANADFLVRGSLSEGRVMPFEVDPPAYTYFFDCGIVIRGWLAVWRATGDEKFLKTADALGCAIAEDFRTGVKGQWHPVLELPSKSPAPYDTARWSRSPGCYQLKSALAWSDLAQATGNPEFRRAYEATLEAALADHESFLAWQGPPDKIVDRLHAYLYFLEGLLARADDPRCAAAIQNGLGHIARQMAAHSAGFERSDVYAQLLRMRLYAEASGAAPLDVQAATVEANTLSQFQAASRDPRIDGGFYFGRRAASFVPHVSPVSTAFAVQALTMWESRGRVPLPPRSLLI